MPRLIGEFLNLAQIMHFYKSLLVKGGFIPVKATKSLMVQQISSPFVGSRRVLIKLPNHVNRLHISLQMEGIVATVGLLIAINA